jgi:hypothetical protein
MKLKKQIWFCSLTALAVLLSACGGQTQPTPDAAAISTAAAQTVEARFTQQAAQQVAPTETPPPPASAATATPTIGFPPTETTAPGLPTPTSNGKACYAAAFVADVTIPDGKIIAPGTKFTKTWRIRNEGNCTWDKTYALQLAQGDALGAPAKVPLTQIVGPGQTVDLSVDMTAPAADGMYAGYWRIATPFGGSFGVGSYDQAILVKIQVTAKSDRYFGSVSVAYDYTRKPAKGCSQDGAYYTFSATITVNGPGEIGYRWDRQPFDGKIEGGTLKFKEAGSQTVYWTWHMTTDHIQNIDRWVAITTIVSSTEKQYERILFHYTCN